MYDLDVDIILTSNGLKNEIQNIILNPNQNVIIMSFEEFIDKRLLVDNRAIGNGRHFDYYLRIIDRWTSININTIFEVGANYGQDAEYCRLVTGANSKNIYTFEANPNISRAIDVRYDFNNYNVAVSEYDGEVIIKMVPPEEANSGISTIADYEYAKEYAKATVKCIRMDSFLSARKEINEIDLLKIDVEGVNYEVLKGFDNKLNIVKCIQIEAEHVSGFKGHNLFPHIYQLLSENNFEMVDYILHEPGVQSDSLWIRRDMLGV